MPHNNNNNNSDLQTFYFLLLLTNLAIIFIILFYYSSLDMAQDVFQVYRMQHGTQHENIQGLRQKSIL